MPPMMVRFAVQMTHRVYGRPKSGRTVTAPMRAAGSGPNTTATNRSGRKATDSSMLSVNRTLCRSAMMARSPKARRGHGDCSVGKPVVRRSPPTRAQLSEYQDAGVDANCRKPANSLVGNLEKSSHSCLNCAVPSVPQIEGVEKCVSLLASWPFSVPLFPWPLLLLSRRPGKARVASVFHRVWTSPC